MVDNDFLGDLCKSFLANFISMFETLRKLRDTKEWVDGVAIVNAWYAPDQNSMSE